MRTMLNILVFTTAIVTTGGAWGNEAYDACLNAADAAYEGERQEEACKCSMNLIGDDEALAQESIALSGMTNEERAVANSSPEINAITAQCFPDYQQEGPSQ